MRIGLDFDNTIVCYDAVFHRVARDLNLIPADIPPNKTAVRDYLRGINREDDWTAMQGTVYGPSITLADLYPGVTEFIMTAQQAGATLCVISHKTRHPFRGPNHDLHASARSFLEAKGITALIGQDNIFFEPTKEAKLRRIASALCTHFIDDLPELLHEPLFPKNVTRYLFDPADLYKQENLSRYTSWISLQNDLFAAKKTA